MGNKLSLKNHSELKLEKQNLKEDKDKTHLAYQLEIFYWILDMSGTKISETQFFFFGVFYEIWHKSVYIGTHCLLFMILIENTVTEIMLY